MDPYRDALVREQAGAPVAEPERPPRGVRVRAWSDGTEVVATRLRRALEEAR